MPKIEVSFDMDSNGILNVTSKDMSVVKASKMMSRGQLSKEDVERMVRDAERFRADDAKQRERIAAMHQLEEVALTYQQTAEELSALALAAKKKCDELLEWVKSNQGAEKGEVEKKLLELERVCTPFMTRIDKRGAASVGDSARSALGSLSGSRKRKASP